MEYESKPTQCETCLAEYDHWTGLSKHICRGYILRCEKCNKIFTRESGFKSHMRRKVPCDSDLRSCKKCGKEFKTLEDTVKHIQQRKSCVAKLETPMICECGRKFKRNADYLKHQRMQRSPCRSSYDCPCGESFDTKVKLFWHCHECVHNYEDIKSTWL